MPEDFKKLNKQRTDAYRKPVEEESFLENLNRYLNAKEEKKYIDADIEHPIIFVIGLPRSGTTLLSQVIAHGLDVAYINNITARFWKAPLHGMKLSDALIGEKEVPQFNSEYGATASLNDIHEFGYFWRKWLIKEGFESIVHAKKTEKNIDWAGLKKVLANLQNYRQTGFIFKNIFGSHHIQKLDELLGKTFWIYIERDLMDVAISNLEARKKFYEDPGTWWSSAPPEYNQLKDLDTIPQISGQLHYLKKFYREQMNELKEKGNGLTISYDDLCATPAGLLKSIRGSIKKLYDYDISTTHHVPDSFPIKSHQVEAKLKKEFESHFKEFQKNDPISELK